MACQDDLLETPSSKGEEIMLSVAIDPVADTRTPYTYVGTAPTSDNPLDALIWASTTSCDFPYNASSPHTGGEDSQVGFHTTVNFQSGNNQLMRDGVEYPNDHSNVYFIGLYPNNIWPGDDHEGGHNTSIRCTYTGKDDVMFAPQVSGKSNAGGYPPNHPTLNFYHLLTLLRIEVKAKNADVISSWGNLTEITLTGQQTSLTVDLSSVPDVSSPVLATRQAAVAGKVTFTGASSNLSFYEYNSNTAFTGRTKALTTGFQEVAYVLCQPVSATEGTDVARTNEYILTLNTANRSGVTVNVDLKTALNTYFAGSTMGHEFVIQLTFAEGGYISVKAMVEPWGEGGYVIQDIEE